LLGTAVGGHYAAATEPSAAVVAKYDKDSDQTLDWAEVQAAASARFDRLNKDTDATLDTQEVKGIIGEAAFKAADTDHDGTLSKAEYLALVKKLFKQADADHDGTLDAQELGSKTGHKLKLLID
jgi:Ca2+-binding EF-hand superfamily protein